MTADPIDTDAIRRKGLTNDIAALCDEVDRMRDAIAAIPRHTHLVPLSYCDTCHEDWPCPTEQAHRLIAAVQPQGLSDGDHAAGPNTDRSCGEGPHDGHVAAQAGPEGTLPAAKDSTIADGFGSEWVRCGPDCDMHVVRPGKAQCNATGTNCPAMEATP